MITRELACDQIGMQEKIDEYQLKSNSIEECLGDEVVKKVGDVMFDEIVELLVNCFHIDLNKGVDLSSKIVQSVRERKLKSKVFQQLQKIKIENLRIRQILQNKVRKLFREIKNQSKIALIV